MTVTSAPPGIPSPARLEKWLSQAIADEPVELTDIQLIAGGRSNLTYRLAVSRTRRRPASRAPPAAARPRAAHRARHVAGVPRPDRAGRHRGAGGRAGGVLRRRRGHRRAVLPDGVRARGGAQDPAGHRRADRTAGRGAVRTAGRHARRDPRRRRRGDRPRRARPRRRIPHTPAEPLAAAVGAVQDQGGARVRRSGEAADGRAPGRRRDHAGARRLPAGQRRW